MNQYVGMVCKGRQYGARNVILGVSVDITSDGFYASNPNIIKFPVILQYY